MFSQVTKSNFLPARIEDRYPVYSGMFNLLVNGLNSLFTLDGQLSIDTIVPFTQGGPVTINGVAFKGGAFTTTGISYYSANASITAFATGGQSNATIVNKEYNDVTTVASDHDSVKLPVAALGEKVIIRNSGAKILDIYPATSGTINSNSANTQISIGPGIEITFEGVSSTGWKTKEHITGSITQITSITTGVTLSKIKGLITTVAATTAGATSSTFTVTNTNATASSNIRAYIVDYAGTFATNGLPVVCVDNRTNGTFDIVISNAHASNALNGALIIGFEIVS